MLPRIVRFRIDLWVPCRPPHDHRVTSRTVGSGRWHLGLLGLPILRVGQGSLVTRLAMDPLLHVGGGLHLLRVTFVARVHPCVAQWSACDELGSDLPMKPVFVEATRHNLASNANEDQDEQTEDQSDAAYLRGQSSPSRSPDCLSNPDGGSNDELNVDCYKLSKTVLVEIINDRRESASEYAPTARTPAELKRAPSQGKRPSLSLIDGGAKARTASRLILLSSWLGSRFHTSKDTSQASAWLRRRHPCEIRSRRPGSQRRGSTEEALCSAPASLQCRL